MKIIEQLPGVTLTGEYHEDDTLYRCTVCGRIGKVGRCCGDDTREPLNEAAREEQRREAAKRSIEAPHGEKK